MVLHNIGIALLVASFVVGSAGVGTAFWSFEQRGFPYPPRAVVAGITGAFGMIAALILLTFS